MMRNLRMKKMLLIAAGIIVCVMLAAVSALFIHRKWKMEIRNQKGILLCFDDYSPESWEDNFDLLDKYGVRATFFVCVPEPTEFCKKVVERGHDIGFHTAGHVNLLEVTEEEFYQQAIAPIEAFRSQGFELTTFAYPYGAYTPEMNEELLKYYDTLRGAYHFEGRYKETIKEAFIESCSLDNIQFESDEAYRAKVDELLDVLAKCDNGTIASVYSHAIGGGGWCITPERLEILFQEAEERDLVFYTFKDLQ